MKRPYLTISNAGKGRNVRTIVTVRHPYESRKPASQLIEAFATAEKLFKRAATFEPVGVTWSFGGFVYTKEHGWRPTPPAAPVFSNTVETVDKACASAIDKALSGPPDFVDFGADTATLPSMKKNDDEDPSEPDAIIALYIDIRFRSVEGVALPHKRRSNSELARMDIRAGNTDIKKLAEKHGLKESTIKKLLREVAKEETPGESPVKLPERVKPEKQPLDDASKSEIIRRAMIGALQRGEDIDVKFFADSYGIPQPMARRLKAEAKRRFGG